MSFARSSPRLPALHCLIGQGAHGLSGDDVVSASIREYFVKLNASPIEIEQMNDLPVKASNGLVKARGAAGPQHQTNVTNFADQFTIAELRIV
jgi:hypothetical protein